MKAGWISGVAGTSDPLLRWDVGGVKKWRVNWEADFWHDMAYTIVRFQYIAQRYASADNLYKISRAVQ